MELLLRRFPGLRGFPHVDLGVRPTPVEEHEIAGVRVRVKRDDLTSARYGGNKARTLEFLLAGPERRVLTFSTLGAHHAYATALFCRDLGKECDLVIVRRGERGPLLARLPGLARRVVEVAHELLLPVGLLRLWRPGTLVIPPGGMSPRGALGYLVAALELEEVPERIYAPLGTGTTVSGLLAGLMLRGARTEVVAVRVASPGPGWRPLLWRRAFRALALLRAWDPAVPRVGRGDVRLRVVPGGGRYAEATPATRAALAALPPGLVLEPTYTGKALAILLAERPPDALLLDTYCPKY